MLQWSEGEQCPFSSYCIVFFVIQFTKSIADGSKERYLSFLSSTQLRYGAEKQKKS